jgi:hypothetical protein
MCKGKSDLFLHFFLRVYLLDMNQRDARQRLLNFPASEDFIEKINSGVVKSGAGDRSKFIRDAIREKFEKMGIDVPVEVWASRPRFERRSEAPVLNESSPPDRITEPPAAAVAKAPAKPAKNPPQNSTP